MAPPSPGLVRSRDPDPSSARSLRAAMARAPRPPRSWPSLSSGMRRPTTRVPRRRASSCRFVYHTAMVEVGKKAPAFTLESSDGGSVKLKDLVGKIVVLYFYPRDNTAGCTIEAEGFRDAIPALE